MSARIPAVAASILLAAAIGTSAGQAHAASARIDPVQTIGNSVYATATLGLEPADSCTVAYRYQVFGAYLNAPMAPVVSGRTQVINPCLRGGIVWEDGSVSTRIGGAVASRASLIRHARYMLAVTTCARAHGRIGCHTTWRSFWA